MKDRKVQESSGNQWKSPVKRKQPLSQEYASGTKYSTDCD
jgi:hypothetical protein